MRRKTRQAGLNGHVRTLRIKETKVDMYSQMFFYYDRASGNPQIGAIAAQPINPDNLDEGVIFGIILNADIEGQEDILEQTMVNPTKWRFAGGFPQSLMN